MEITLDQIFMKPSDFKICKSCKKINCYENKLCQCGAKKFNNSKKAVQKAYQSELDFWIKEEGYTEQEADNIYYEV